MKIAVIDIGSNSVRLMLWADGTTLYKKLFTTRLGAGLAISSRLSGEAIARTVGAVSACAAEARAAGAEAVYAFATASVRRAENGAEFTECVKAACGLAVDVVSGEEESELALCGALGTEDGAVLDIGGASTELCVREGGRIAREMSLDVGAVRLFDLCHDDVPLLRAAVERAISPLKGVKTGPLVAVGGTATSLAAVKLRLAEYDAAAVQGCTLSRKEISELANGLLVMSAEERRALAGMDPHRADVIAGGAYLLDAIVGMLGLGGITVSDRDNLEGYLVRKGL